MPESIDEGLYTEKPEEAADEEFSSNLFKDEPEAEDKSFTDELKSEGVADDGPPPPVRPRKPVRPRRKPMGFKKAMAVVFAVLAVFVIVIGAFLLWGGGGSEKPKPSAEKEKSIFDNKAVLPMNADINGVIPPSALTNAQAPASNTPAAMVNAPIVNAPEANAPVVNAPSAQAVAPKPKPEPVPAPKPEPKQTHKPEPPSHGHYVQFGVFGSKANAKSMASDLKTVGLDATIKEYSNHAGKPIYRVVMPEVYATEGEARDIARQVRRSKDIETSTYAE